MGWASAAIEGLRQAQVVTLCPRGHSMAGRINHGAQVTVKPIGDWELQVGDVVLVRIHGREYLHLIKAIQGGRFLIGNNGGGINGWAGRLSVAGIASVVAPAEP